MDDRTDAWWAKAYDQMRELQFYYHYIDFETAQWEIPFIEAALSLAPGARILDLGWRQWTTRYPAGTEGLPGDGYGLFPRRFGDGEGRSRTSRRGGDFSATGHANAG